MLRALIIALLLSPTAMASGMPEFDLARTSRRQIELFADDGPVAPVQPAPGSASGKASVPAAEKASQDDPEVRSIDNWYGRGFGIGIVATGALAYPGAGVGLELSIPLDPHVGLVLRGGIIGNIFFEGSYYDIGPRGYFDLSRNFTLYVDGGLRLVYGRILGYAGNSLRHHVLHRLGIGGFSDLGLEVGSPKIRFFAEVTFNGAKTLGEEFQVMVFCGVHIGVRFYIGG